MRRKKTFKDSRVKYDRWERVKKPANVGAKEMRPSTLPAHTDEGADSHSLTNKSVLDFSEFRPNVSCIKGNEEMTNSKSKIETFIEEVEPISEFETINTDEIDGEDTEEQLLNTPQELEQRIAGIKDGSISRGPVLLSRKMLQGMKHIPAFASVIFNPFGPTIDTVTLSSYSEPHYREYLIRRSLHPFSQEKNQVLSMVPDYGGDIKKFCKYLMRITKIFIGNNATTRASKDLWAHELIGSIPTGVLVDKSSIFSIGTKEGFAYLLQHAETLLEGEVDKIRKYGSDFWKATPQLSEMLKRIQDGYEELPIEFPEIVNVVPPISSSKNPNFLTWWDMVVEERYQKDLYRVIKEAWYGSVHQFSGGSLLRTMDDAEEFGNEDDDADFSSWWSLFDPNKRDKQ